jgi:alpha-D-ribose 1-methylphosphonate 5-triphosphate synthase subunit PhnI
VDRRIVREKLAELELVAGCEITNAGLDELERWFYRGYRTALPEFKWSKLPVRTSQERAFLLGNLTRRIELRKTLCIGRSLIKK